MVPTHGLPFLLHEGLEVVPVPPELKGQRRLTVASCSSGGSGQLVLFSGVRTLQEASKLVGKQLLVRVADLPADFALKDVEALMGRVVHDVQCGLVGTICEVMRTPAHDVWVVRGPNGEVLIPAVAPIVCSLAEGDAIVVDLPQGLVDTGEPTSCEGGEH